MHRRIIMLTGLLILALPAVASAAEDAPPPSPTLVLPTDQLWALAVGLLVPLVTYVLNYVGPWVSEPVKAGVLVIAAAVAGGLAQAITAGDVGFNTTTLQFVLTAVLSALSAHRILWKPSGVSAKLGGGQNRQVVASTPQ